MIERNKKDFLGEEEMKHIVLEKLGIDPNKNYKDFDLIQQGKTENPEVRKILEKCGGKPVECKLDCFVGDHHEETKRYGWPDYLVRIKEKNKKTILVIELKPQQHQSDKLNKPKSHNLDGALYYAKYFKNNYNVLILAITGQGRKIKDLKITFGIWRNQNKIYETIYQEREVFSLNEYFSRLENKSTVEVVKRTREVAKDLHNRLRFLTITEEDKPLFISFCLIALKDSTFSAYLARKEFPNEERLLEDLKDIPKKVIGKDYQEKLFKKIEGVLENKKLGKEHEEKKNRLSSILTELREKVIPFMNGSSVDVIGVFYHEFLKYSKGDGGGLGIVLTPSHIADLFTELVDLKPIHKVLDICCGTGSFLIAALNKMQKEAKREEKEQIKKNLYGIESQPKVYYLVLTNMILHGDGKSHIYQEDCFDTERKDQETGELKKIGKTIKDVVFDRGFLNPPYSVKGGENEGKFIYLLLNLMKEGGKVAIITHLRLARGGVMKKERKNLLEKHTLEAVMTMPDDLFYGNQSKPPTCVMVWTANQTHKGKTWLASWKNDGFVIDNGQRIEKEIKYTIKDLETEIKNTKKKGEKNLNKWELEKIHRLEQEIKEWKKDNEEREKEGQKEIEEKVKGQWSIKKKEWKEKYDSKKDEIYVSKSELFTLEQVAEQSWLPEDHLEVDYSFLKEEGEKKFMASIQDYLSYVMVINTTDASLVSFSKLAEELENNQSISLSLDTENWREFSLTTSKKREKNGKEIEIKGLNFTVDEANQTDFRVKDGKGFRESQEYIPLISTSKKNNGCVSYVENSPSETKTKWNCISFSSFGGFFYQPIDFYRAYADQGNIWCLRNELINQKRGLFISALLNIVEEGRWNYGRQLNNKTIKYLTIKLPVDKEGSPDWEFMEDYVKQVVSALSLSLSLWKYNFYKS